MSQAPSIQLLLDTAYCLALIRHQLDHLEPVFARFKPGEVGVSSLTVAALQERAQKSRSPERNRRALEQFLLPLAIADFDTTAAAVLGRIAAELAPQELALDSHALLLAAHALSLNATLITPQAEQYVRLADLRVNSGAGAALAQLDMLPTAERKTPAEPVGTIYAFGSHDITLDLLGDQLNAAHPGLALVSAHVGSLGGLLALQQRQAHLAGAHLLDEATGTYNEAHIRRLLLPQGLHVALFGFVTRMQGLLVQRGNPQGIHGVEDLARGNVRFVNRQRGAGTRVLLDHHLQHSGLSGEMIMGYAREESSHLGVATAVASGEADCGLGIQAAAQAHGLDFLPLAEERYDLVIPVEHAESELLAPLLTMLRRPPADFLRRIAVLGGYGTARMGKLIAEL
jgi:molybdate-binding protein/predicted nucleic acid-binding protein